ncbi:MAG: lysylphosphatidylglycerol synthase transmembrane domain-containing protein [Candidatus Krumholzibacteriaceae bacterium]|jgi:uncharacterized membrane protein YbhN (UPF0104 family)
MIEHARRHYNDVYRQILGYLIAAACLVWVFHGIHGERLVGQLKGIRWGWVAVAIVLDVLSYVCQGVRWRFLLRPTGNISTMRATQAVYVGLFTNEIVPFRAGELVRAYIVSRWQGVALLSVIPSLAVERLFDGLWLAVGMGLTAIFVVLPENLLRAADIFGCAILAAVALFVYVVIRKKKDPHDGPPSHAVRWKPLRLFGTLTDGVAQGIRKIGMTRYFYFALVTSSFIIIFQIVSFWLIMNAYGLHLSLWAGAAVFIIVYFGTALPNMPSNVGTYQFFAVLALALFGIDKTTAAGFSIAVFVILTGVLWIIGLVAIGRTGMRLKDIRREIGEVISRK